MGDRKKILKWSARIIGGLAVLFFGAFFIGEGILGLAKDSYGHLSSMMILIGFATLGYVFAWFREKEGGLVMIISGVIIGLNMFYSSKMINGGIIILFSIPFIISGILFLFLDKTIKKY